MKRIICAAMVCMMLVGLCLCFTGCEKYDFPEELKQYLSPWELDVCAEAQKNNSIHYYFMCSKGLFMDETELYPYKWGDSCLVVFPDGKTMLIDTGMQNYAPVLVENLRRMKIKRLDYVVFSHQHNDHTFGALKEGGIFDHFEIGQVYWNGIYNSNWVTTSVEQVCKDKKIPLQILKRGDTLDLGAVKAEVLWPKEEMVGKTLDNTEDLNNNSIVIRLDYKEHASLFTGDLYTQGESDILETNPEKLDVDLVKVCHHGHNTSSSSSFIGAVSPKVAVSTGYQPAISRILSAYENIGATYLDDQYYGYIHVVSDGTELEYDTAISRGDNR